MAVQFLSPGIPLFKSTGIVAMDPDCCCGNECPLLENANFYLTGLSGGLSSLNSTIGDITTSYTVPTNSFNFLMLNPLVIGVTCPGQPAINIRVTLRGGYGIDGRLTLTWDLSPASGLPPYPFSYFQQITYSYDPNNVCPHYQGNLLIPALVGDFELDSLGVYSCFKDMISGATFTFFLL